MQDEPNPYNQPPKWSFKINLLAVRDWWVKRKRAKRLTEAELYEWVYEECGCKGGAKHLSNPY